MNSAARVVNTRKFDSGLSRLLHDDSTGSTSQTEYDQARRADVSVSSWNGSAVPGEPIELSPFVVMHLNSYFVVNCRVYNLAWSTILFTVFQDDRK